MLKNDNKSSEIVGSCCVKKQLTEAKVGIGISTSWLIKIGNFCEHFFYYWMEHLFKLFLKNGEKNEKMAT